MWSIAIGMREGITFGNFYKLTGKQYHLIRRYLEQGGLVLSVFGLGLHISLLWAFKMALIFTGLMWMLTFPVYEVALDKTSKGEWKFFKENNPYDGKNQGRWKQIGLTMMGLLLLLIGIFI